MQEIRERGLRFPFFSPPRLLFVWLFLLTDTWISQSLISRRFALNSGTLPLVKLCFECFLLLINRISHPYLCGYQVGMFNVRRYNVAQSQIMLSVCILGIPYPHCNHRESLGLSPKNAHLCAYCGRLNRSGRQKLFLDALTSNMDNFHSNIVT